METLFILFFYVNYYLLSYETIPTLPTSAWSPLLSLALVLLSRSPVVLPSSLSLSLSFALVFSIRFPRIVSPTFRPTQTLLFPLHHFSFSSSSFVLLLLKNTTEDAFALKFSFLFLSLSLLILLLSGGGQDTNVSQEREESDDTKGCRWCCRETPTFGGPRKRISADGGGSSHVGIARGSKSFGRKKNSSSSSSSSSPSSFYIVVVYRRINTFPSSSRNTFVNSKDEKKTSDVLALLFSSNDKSKKGVSDLGFIS